MSFLAWVAVAGGVLLLVGLASSYVRQLPVSVAALYLGLGLALGPAGFAVLDFDLLADAPTIEHVAELGVTVALFVGGLELRLGWRHPAWRAAYLLAGPAMVLTIAGLAAVAHLALGLPLGAALVLAAVLAPTDPVLAGEVSVKDAADFDPMRFGLSGEAGLNDGAAFPFVVLALAWGPGLDASALAEWAVVRVLWAVPAALVLGYALGRGVGRLAIALRTHHRDTAAPSDLLALSLIALAYAGGEVIGAWGFLAVFAAGVGLRAAEVHVVTEHPHPDAPDPASVEGFDHPPAEDLVPAQVREDALGQPAVAAGVLVTEALTFGDTIERMVECAVLVAIGAALASHWDVRALPLAAALFFVIRPLAATLVLRAAPVTRGQRWLMGWFGIRGIGSLYYLAYALTHGLDPGVARTVADLSISVVALSVLVHGASATPLLSRYAR